MNKVAGSRTSCGQHKGREEAAPPRCFVQSCGVTGIVAVEMGRSGGEAGLERKEKISIASVLPVSRQTGSWRCGTRVGESLRP